MDLKDPETKKTAIWAMGLVALLALLYFRIEQRRMMRIEQSSKSTGANQTHLQRANEHLFLTSEADRIAREKVETEIAELRQKLETGKLQTGPAPTSPNKGFNYEVQENSFRKENQLDNSQAPLPHSPTELVQEERNYQIAESARRAEYMQRHLRDVIKSARDQGYELKLGDDGTILSMKPMKTHPKQEAVPEQNRMPDSDGSSRQ